MLNPEPLFRICSSLFLAWLNPSVVDDGAIVRNIRSLDSFALKEGFWIPWLVDYLSVGFSRTRCISLRLSLRPTLLSGAPLPKCSLTFGAGISMLRV